MFGPMQWGQGADWMMGWGEMVGPIVMIALWVALIAGIAWLAIALSRQGRGNVTGSALSILQERLARGEIDLDEFNARKAAILQAS